MKFIRILTITLTVFSLMLLSCEEQTEQPGQPKEVEEKVVPVETMIIKSRSLTQSITLTGTLQPVNSVTIVAEVSGKIIEVRKDVGDKIDTSDVLAVIDEVIPESQYQQAKSEVLSAANNLEIAKSNFKSDKILFDNHDISELAFNNSKLAVETAEARHLSALAALKLARKTFYDTRVKSPVSGIVAKRYMNKGSMASIGAPLYDVVDIETLKIQLNVAQEYINRISRNNKVDVIIPALNNRSFEGTIKRISPQADLTSGGYLVEAEVLNKDKIIKGGMTARVEVILNNLNDVVVIPEYALLTKNKENYVYKIEDDRANLVKVNTGQATDGFITINEGLQPGDEIVVVGLKNLGLDTKVMIENKAE